jgi:hypothetical protein
MYVLVAAAAIIWSSSCSAGALPLLRHDDHHHHHLHITPKLHLHHRYNLWSSDRTLFPDPAAVRTTDRAAEDANSKGVEKLQRKKNSARSEAHPRKKIVKKVKKCGLQSRACLLCSWVNTCLKLFTRE